MWNSSRGSGILSVVVVVLCGVASTFADSEEDIKSAPPSGTAQDRSGWVVTCDSAQTGNECTNAIDGDPATFWHTESDPNNAPLPHTMTIDMNTYSYVTGVGMNPRQDGSQDGFIARHEILLSTDGDNFGSPVAYGTWFADKSEKFAIFEPTKARYVRLVALTEGAGNPCTSISEMNIYATPSMPSPSPSQRGVWGPTIDLPIVPAAASVLPDGKILVWSSWRNNKFDFGPGGFTLTATYDPATGLISQRTVTDTKHDMFCPGISTLADGRIVVTGGNDAAKTSIYDPSSDSWVAGPNMNTSRGYQASATCSDGRVFTIGGSWGGGVANKNGEIYDPSTNEWTALPDCDVKPMLTDDEHGLYRADNHAMLFGWKSNTVFQAGPSKAMNWYTTTGSGGVTGAGLRGDDGDAMCGSAVMYKEGKVLTCGGSPNYQGSESTANSYVISIDAPNTEATVRRTGNMTFSRIFHNIVVLPNGESYVTGGQRVGNPFYDTTPRLTPEMYSPTTNEFRLLAPNSTPRTYHSIALLLHDATVMCGGGGLCGTCNNNHFDAQIYSPSYLFLPSGARATRPSILRISASTVKVSSKITIVTDTSVNSACMIRFGTTTHTVDTDQRRLELALTPAGENAYDITMPDDYGIMIPGHWMLFVMDSNEVPSVAKTMLVTLSYTEKKIFSKRKTPGFLKFFSF